MKSQFPGFPPEGMKFLRDVARHNDRDWFLPRKPIFDEKLKKPMLQLVEVVNAAMKRFAPDYLTEPNKAVYRFYRDTRFSKNKKPYKDHIAASFRHRFIPSEGVGAGFYFHISPKEIGIGGGVYMPPPETLRAIRTHVGEFHRELETLLNARNVKKLFGEMHGEELTRIPKGFACDHPAADLLRKKQFLLWSELPAEIATTPELYNEIVTRFQAMTPFMEFLNAPLMAKGRIRPRMDTDAHG